MMHWIYDKAGSLIRKYMLFLVAFLLSGAVLFHNLTVSLVLCAEKKDSFFSLREEEERYLQTIREDVLTIAVSEKSAYHADEELPWGMIVPLLDFFEYELELEVELVWGTWEENRAALAAGTVDMLFGIPVQTKEATEELTKESGIYVSAPFYEEALYLVLPKERAIGSLYSKDTSVGVVTASFWAELAQPWLQGMGSQREFADTHSLVQALAEGKIQAAVVPQAELTWLFEHEELEIGATLLAHEAEITIGTGKTELVKLFELLERYLQETEEGEAALAAMKAERLRGWIKELEAQETELLQDIKNRYAAFTYTSLTKGSFPLFWVKEGNTCGVLGEMLDFFEELTGIPAEYVKTADDAEALSQLEEGELVLLGGLLQNAENDEAFYFLPLSGRTDIVAVRSESERGRLAEDGLSRLSKKEQVAYSYWGTTSDVLPFLQGTVFDGHTVGFGSEAELLAAMQEGTVGGVLVERGVYEAQLVTMETELLLELPYEMSAAFTLLDENSAFNSLIEKLVHIYELTHPNAWESWETVGNAWLVSEREKAELLQKQWMYAGLAGALVLAMGLLVALVRAVSTKRG